MMIDIVVGGYSREEAWRMVKNIDSAVKVEKVDEVYYPYKRISYDINVGKGRADKFNKKTDCIIDLVRGSVATGEGVPAYKTITVKDQAAIGIQIENSEAHRLGHDFVLKLFLNKAKMLRTPQIVISGEDLFYKNY